MNHVLNTTTFTIRTESEVIATTVGISNALDIVRNLADRSGVGVFFDGTSMSAMFFTGWATKIDRLINHGIGWDGKKVA